MTRNHSVSVFRVFCQKETELELASFFLFPDTFLQINDQINTVLNRYEAFKKGDYITSSNPIPSEYAQSASSSAGNNALSLIDLDDVVAVPTSGVSLSSSSPGGGGGGGGIDDLVSLFGSISPTAAAPAGGPPPIIPHSSSPSSLPSSSSFSRPISPSQRVGAIVLPGTPQPFDRRPSPFSTVTAANVHRDEVGGGMRPLQPQQTQ